MLFRGFPRICYAQFEACEKPDMLWIYIDGNVKLNDRPRLNMLIIDFYRLYNDLCSKGKKVMKEWRFNAIISNNINKKDCILFICFATFDLNPDNNNNAQQVVFRGFVLKTVFIWMYGKTFFMFTRLLSKKKLIFWPYT